MSAPGKIGAFFDLDGTLLAPPSLEWRFIGYLLDRDEIATKNVARWVAQSAKVLPNGERCTIFANKHYLAGIHESVVAEWANTITCRSLPLFVEGIDRVHQHLECGHGVVLVTGTLAPLARAIVGHLPRGIEVRATKLEIRDDFYTGRISGAHLGFAEKARVIHEYAEGFDLDLRKSFAYGNEMSDARMLEAVGHPVAVNASWSLKREARKRGWSAYSWRDLREGKGRTPHGALAKEARMKPCEPAPAREIASEDTAEWPSVVRGRVEDNSSRSFDDIRRALGAFEWVTFAYLAWLNAMLAVFHRNVAHAAQYFVIHCWIALGIVCLAWAAAHSQNRVLRFARDWYPLPLYIFFFEELQGLVHAIFPGWFDRWLIQFDFNFAGVHPSVWLARFSNPGLNDFMQFAYMTYFLYLVILPAILYAQKDRIAFWNVMVSTAVANYTVYFIAVLFPIESPFHALATMNTAPLNGGYFTAVIEFIERFGRVHGGAFPSAHVAGSTVAILASWRYRRWLFWVCLPFFTSMCVSTVYGRYHYIADVLAGIVVGALGFAAGSWLMERRGALAEIAV
jgi:HAD superfamily hydrolase (TIGR01490 family)